MSILGILKALVQIVPFLDKLLSLFKKSTQEKVEKSVEDARSEIDEFKKTGRPPR